MLCRFCESWDWDILEKSWVTHSSLDTYLPANFEDWPCLLHHESYADLIASAEAGCDLCTLFRGGLKQDENALLEDHKNRPRRETQIVRTFNQGDNLLVWKQPGLGGKLSVFVS